ncbi:hypothetical protein CEXT_333231 [Caerostris extrusa]|uniref:Uncharacterized protein n=1 Tax=Caerostris extrusa TaxID=172846 RepID=A0AAV4UBM1_CAEEX|nr:hypothetical protein CEXT_333231 [Caerostris extrusa]
MQKSPETIQFFLLKGRGFRYTDLLTNVFRAAPRIEMGEEKRVKDEGIDENISYGWWPNALKQTSKRDHVLAVLISYVINTVV